MYPYFRLAKEFIRHRNAPALGPFDEHRATHICWPWDIDPFLELNNGRTLTLYDLGRFLLFRRIGTIALMKERRWTGTIAGASVRYRRRVRMFDTYELRSKMIGWDDRFFYIEQGMWRKGECTSHGLLRMAVTGGTGIVPPADFAAAFGADLESPPLPSWVTAWIAAEAERPWPPMHYGEVPSSAMAPVEERVRGG
ncbi:MAG: acyl-CoA thioesterase [Pseudomonadota bacterium]